MTFDMSGIEDMRANIDRLTKAVDDAARIAVTDGGHLIERRAKQNAPVLTGTLRRSIHVDSVISLGPGKWQSLTGPTMIYARIRELGGTIRPRNKPSLSWIGPNGQRIVLAPGQSVTQTGTHYMMRAFTESVTAVGEIYRTAFREALDL